jgi:hypothetical protein
MCLNGEIAYQVGPYSLSFEPPGSPLRGMVSMGISDSEQTIVL